MGTYHGADNRDCVRQIMLRGKVSLELGSKAKLAYICKGYDQYIFLCVWFSHSRLIIKSAPAK